METAETTIVQQENGGAVSMSHQAPCSPFKCPVCDGTGLVSKPPWIAGDQQTWVSSSTGPWPCKACDGTGIVWANADPHTRAPARTVQVVVGSSGGDK